MTVFGLGGVEHTTKMGVGGGRRRKGCREKRDRGSRRWKGEERGREKKGERGSRKRIRTGFRGFEPPFSY